MKIFVVALLAIAVLFASVVSATLFGGEHKHQRRVNDKNKENSHHHHSAEAFAHISKNVDMIKAFNSFMCSTSSKHCVEAGNIDFHTFRLNVILRGLEFAHEMVHPKTLAQKALRHSLPRSVQSLFQTAKKFVSKHKVAEAAPEIAHHRASAKAVMDAMKEITGDLAADKYAYFGWLPQWTGDALVGSSTTFSTSCVGAITVATNLTGNTLTTTTTASKDGFFCDDMLLLLVGDGGFRIQIVDKDAPTVWELDVSTFTAEQRWYMGRHGVRVLKFPKGLVQTIGQLIATVTALAGYGEHVLTNQTLSDNLQFLKDYVEASPRMQPLTEFRQGGSTVGYALESYINSGDSFIVMRPDGLDPMIGWGEGWTSGHSTIAMRDANNTLYVCESTTLDAYWPTNGIQCTVYPTWIKQYTEAQMSILHAPLAPQYRAAFNVDKAWEFFRQHDGLNYGFANFLFGWVDMENSNFPCLPPDYKICLMREAVEQLALILDKVLGPDNTNIFRQAINHRAGTQGMTVLGAFYTANMRQGANNAVTLADLWVKPELDSWTYNMTWNNGTTTDKLQCSVCCVFVCRMWKAAGLFNEIDNQINCGEQTLWDIFSMQIYDTTKMNNGRPEICKQNDPTNPLCQLTGVVTLFGKPDFNTRKLYKNMGEKCSSVAPDYVRQPGC